MFDIFFQESVILTPILMIDGDADGNWNFASECGIRMDGHMLLCEKVDVSLAISCLIAVYFVYGISYPKKLKNMFAFVERFVCKMPVTGKLPIPVARINALLFPK